MNDELAARHRAITLRLAGRPVKSICDAVGRSRIWFHKWWRRYLESGVEGLYDRTRANHRAQRIAPELERTILSIRRRLQNHTSSATRYSLVSMDPNPYEVTEPELLRGLRLSWRGGLLPDRPGFSVGSPNSPIVTGPCRFLPGPTGCHGLGRQSLRAPASSTLGFLHDRGLSNWLIPGPDAPLRRC